MSDNQLDNLMTMIEKYPFVFAIDEAFPDIEEIRPVNTLLEIRFKDDTLIIAKGFYKGITDEDAVELVRLAINEDKAFKTFQRARDDAHKAFKDTEYKLAQAYQKQVKSFTDEFEDIQRRRKS